MVIGVKNVNVKENEITRAMIEYEKIIEIKIQEIIFKSDQDMNSIVLLSLINLKPTSDLENKIRGRLIKKNNPIYHNVLKDLSKDGIKVSTVLNRIRETIKKEKEKVSPYNKNS
ncbi:MAG: hypothetical protein ACFFFT_09530 [Candidatus Thorarchaeota archaeon]